MEQILYTLCEQIGRATSELQSRPHLVCRPPSTTLFPYTTLFRSSVKQRDCIVCGTQSALVNCFTASKCVYSTTAIKSISMGLSEMFFILISLNSTCSFDGTNIVHSVRTDRKSHV